MSSGSSLSCKANADVFMQTLPPRRVARGEMFEFLGAGSDARHMDCCRSVGLRVTGADQVSSLVLASVWVVLLSHDDDNDNDDVLETWSAPALQGRARLRANCFVGIASARRKTVHGHLSTAPNLPTYLHA